MEIHKRNTLFRKCHRISINSQDADNEIHCVMNFTSTECIFDVSLVEDSLIVVESLSKFQNEAPLADAPPYPEQK